MTKIDQTTLVIRHLPQELNAVSRVDLMKRLGAVDVACVASEIKKNSITFAKFNSHCEAENVLKFLHQKEILGQFLSVEYAKFDGRCQPFHYSSDGNTALMTENTTSQKYMMESYISKLTSWTNSLELRQPPPLFYHYPPPNTKALQNICKALAKVPKFYTQVLHLMNKMNLPCPFVENFEIDSDLIENDFYHSQSLHTPSEDESEIDTDIDELQATPIESGAPKRPRFPANKLRVNIKQFKKPTDESAVRPTIKPEEVFETKIIQVPKKIELKVSSELNLLGSGEPCEFQERFGMLETSALQNLISNNSGKIAKTTTSNTISSEELELNRIPAKDFHLLHVFKNYNEGSPNCRLYIKNLAKTVQVADLEFIFNRYRVEDQVDLFNVRLMKEGRMKGQAFVTLQSVDLAERAVKEINGYILQGKAMVVQFARCSK